MNKQQRNQQILDMLDTHEQTIASIGKRFGVSDMLVYKIWKQQRRIPYRRNGVMDTRQRNQQILAVLDTGALTLQEVADYYGVTRQRVHQIYQKERGQSYEPTRQAFKQAHPELCQHCSKPAGSLGLCKNHYQKLRYHTYPGVREKHHQTTRRWQREHPEQVRRINQRAAKRYYQAHREKKIEYSRRYYQEHKVEWQAYNQARRQRRKQQK